MKKLTPEIKPLDDGAWKEAVKGVKKLPETEPRPEAPLIINEIEPTVNYAAVSRRGSLKKLDVGETPDVDRRTAEKFKRGEFKIEARLNLHGLTEKEAYEAVEAFVKKSYLRGCRCILIITGKGLHKETEDWYEIKGILKEKVPQWLNAPELRPLLLSFCHARREDGGEGALYVLLRRRH